MSARPFWLPWQLQARGGTKWHDYDRLGEDMAIPDYQALMLPVLLLAAAKEQRVATLAGELADELRLPPEEREVMLPSGRQRLLNNRIHWAKFYMSKAGLISSPGRGRFAATEEGRRLLSKNPARINVALLQEYPSFREFYKAGSDHVEGNVASVSEKKLETVPTITPEEQIETAYQAVQSALRGDLLERIGSNSAEFFEGLIVDLLVAMGYGGSRKNAATQLGRSGDGGVDGVINEDRLGLDRVYVQAKRYGRSNAVGRPEVQGFVGSLVGLGATKGVFVTTSTFSNHARQFVQHLSQRVILIDGEALADLMIEHGVGVRTFRAIEFRRLDEDFFSEDD
jgi:restriction system protein